MIERPTKRFVEKQSTQTVSALEKSPLIREPGIPEKLPIRGENEASQEPASRHNTPADFCGLPGSLLPVRRGTSWGRHGRR